ncbi:hypothetical protein [Thalassiella azotivora]
MVTVNSAWGLRLQHAQSSQSGIRLLRSIPGADVLQGYVVGVGRKWVLLAGLSGARLDGFAAVRVRDVARIQPMPAGSFPQKVAEAAGTWPPSAPATAIDLDRTRGLIETAHVDATLVTLHIEDQDPEVGFIGVPTRYSDRNVWLQEVTPQAVWDGTVSQWRFSELTRVDFDSDYENDLLLVAGPPPSH